MQLNDDFEKKLLKQFSYENLLIINFLRDSETESFARSIGKKWKKGHVDKPATILDGKIFLDTDTTVTFQTDKISGDFRIDILAHGSPNTNYLTGDDGWAIHYLVLAEKLAKLIGNQNVVINLVSCGAGRGEDDHPHENTFQSFAAKLHEKLIELLGRDVPVVARTQLTYINFEVKDKSERGTKTTADVQTKFTEVDREKPAKKTQPGSKIIITSDQKDEQIKLDAYILKWKRKVISKLRQIQNITDDTKIKSLMSSWLTAFENLPANTIAKNIDDELKDEKSPLQARHSSFIRLFTEKDEFQEFEILVEEWTQLSSNEYTLLNAKPTRTTQTLDPYRDEFFMHEQKRGDLLLRALAANPKQHEISFRKLIKDTSDRGVQFRKAIIPELNKTIDNNLTGLEYLAMYSPKSLLELCSIANEVEKGKPIRAICSGALDNPSVLNNLFRYEYQSIILLCKAAFHHNDTRLLDAIAPSLLTRFESKKTGFNFFIYSDASLVPNLVERLLNLPSLYKLKTHLELLIDNLRLPNDKNVIAWQLIPEKYQQKILDVILQAIARFDTKNLESFIEELTKLETPDWLSRQLNSVASIFNPQPEKHELIKILIKKSEDILKQRQQLNKPT